MSFRSYRCTFKLHSRSLRSVKAPIWRTDCCFQSQFSWSIMGPRCCWCLAKKDLHLRNLRFFIEQLLGLGREIDSATDSAEQWASLGRALVNATPIVPDQFRFYDVSFHVVFLMNWKHQGQAKARQINGFAWGGPILRGHSSTFASKKTSNEEASEWVGFTHVHRNKDR